MAVLKAFALWSLSWYNAATFAVGFAALALFSVPRAVRLGEFEEWSYVAGLGTFSAFWAVMAVVRFRERYRDGDG